MGRTCKKSVFNTAHHRVCAETSSPQHRSSALVLYHWFFCCFHPYIFIAIYLLKKGSGFYTQTVCVYVCMCLNRVKYSHVKEGVMAKLFIATCEWKSWSINSCVSGRGNEAWLPAEFMLQAGILCGFTDAQQMARITLRCVSGINMLSLLFRSLF